MKDYTAPDAKVTAAGIGGVAGVPVAVVIVYVAKQFFKTEIPTEVALAIAAILSGIFGFVAGYMKKS